MKTCDVCYGLKVYQQQPCIACNGTGEKIVYGFNDPQPPHMQIKPSIYYQMHLNKYQHLVDENIHLSDKQKEVLRILLTSDSFFLPFSFDGDWDYIYSKGKVVLVSKLLLGDWNYALIGTQLEDEIYALVITFHKKRLLKEFCDDIFKNELRRRASEIEIYLSYHDYIKFYQRSVSEASAQFWRSVLKEEDLKEIDRLMEVKVESELEK